MTDLIEVKTADLAGEALGWAVAQAEGLKPLIEPPAYGNPHRVFVERSNGTVRYKPWDDWTQGGPLIEKHAAMVRGYPNQMHETLAIARVRIDGSLAWRSGDTPLIALCRALLCAKLGKFAHVPKELQP